MPVLDVETDPDRRTMTIAAVFAASVERVWQVYADARQLERVWGPPGWPATFVEHALVPGGRSHYFMTGEDGTAYHGVWRTLETDPPAAFVVEDAFADEQGAPNEDLGWTRIAASFDPHGDGTRVVLVSTFSSAEQLQQQLDMGMDEGLRLAMGQIDDVLAEPAA